jgi:hypothetical protein
MREQSRSISRGLKINKNSAEGEVFLVDFPSYRTLQAVPVDTRAETHRDWSGLRILASRVADGWTSYEK